MKRDVDLCRQLLMDLENQGPHRLLTTLRCDEVPEANQRIDHHLRLLIDAGFVKETERTGSGVPCVRLTHSGQELIELTGNENRWREAKWIVQQQTGGLSLTVLMALLTKWAVDGTACCEQGLPGRHVYPPFRYQAEGHQAEGHQTESAYRLSTSHTEQKPLDEDPLRPAHSHPDDRKRVDVHNSPTDRQKRAPCEIAMADEPTGITLPVFLI
jgi:hypothetical protein